MKIAAEEAGKRFRSLWALRQVSTTLPSGSVTAVIGPNGAGKTTWLRLLAGVMFPTEGRITFDGRAFDRRDIPFRRQLFFLPDLLPAAGNFSPLRHAAMVFNLYGIDPEEVRAPLMELYKDFDLLSRLDSPLGQLSRGQVYKAVLAPLLLTRARLWLVDEPFAAGMDPEGMMVFREKARAAARDGCTVVFTTQILEIAEDFADSIMILHQGKLVDTATPADLAARSGHGKASAGLAELLRKLRTSGEPG